MLLFLSPDHCDNGPVRNDKTPFSARLRSCHMATCSVRSCNGAAIAGFAELIEVNSISFPRRTVPAGTRYRCKRHPCLSLELQGKLGQAIDLMETVIPGRSSASVWDRDGLSATGSISKNETTTGKRLGGGEKR